MIVVCVGRKRSVLPYAVFRTSCVDFWDIRREARRKGGGGKYFVLGEEGVGKLISEIKEGGGGG